MKKHPLTRGFCKNCGKEVEGRWEDCGIGSYEFWGAKGTDVDWRRFCAECDEELGDVEVQEPDYPDSRDEPIRERDYPEDDWREDR